MIQKQAIMDNLAGFARNNPDGTVGLELQGDEDRIAKTVEAVSAGNKKSSHANIIGEAQALFDPNLKTFTKSWLRESEQSVEWIFCLTAARVLVANQEQR
jgi:acylphosphatase